MLTVLRLFTIKRLRKEYKGWVTIIARWFLSKAIFSKLRNIYDDFNKSQILKLSGFLSVCYMGDEKISRGSLRAIDLLITAIPK